MATSLAEGLAQLAQRDDFDAVLLDLTLPDSEGLDTLQQLIFAYPSVTVIVLTGAADREQGIRAVRTGAQDYLVKNEFNPAELARVIRFSIERKQVLMRLEEAQRIAKIGNWELRFSHNHCHVSKQVYRIMGMAIDPDFKCSDILVPTHPFHLLLAHHQTTANQPTFIRTFKVTTPDGSTRHLLLNSQRHVSESGELVYRGTLQDTTLQSEAEELQRAKELAEQAAKVREQVIANVSHELRTPMNAIVGMSNLLSKTPLDAEQQEYIQAMQEASQFLLGVINDILMTSSLQHGDIDMDYVPFDMAQTLRLIVDALRPKAAAKGLAIHIETDLPAQRRCIGAKQRISQVLYNIIGNAVKFTDRGHVAVSVRCMGNDDEAQLAFTIADTGAGIPPERQMDIFQPFNRVSHAGKSIEGTGLGLAIAKQLVERMGGSLKLDSTVGQGSTFSFSLPARWAAADAIPDAAMPASVPTKASPRSVLIVEDHRMNQIVLTKTLQKQWPLLHIALAEDGAQALDLLAQGQVFDLIFMDIQLPDMDGYTVTQRIRHGFEGRYADTPVLAMTAQIQVAEDERFQAVKMTDYVLKPFLPEELFMKITQYTEQFSTANEHKN
jgi:signal transduction histidine kinase